MSEASGYAIPSREMPSILKESVHFDADEQEIDINMTYDFQFAPQRWMAGVQRLVGAVLTGAIGGFLLSQIPSTPALVAQLAMVGALLALTGPALLAVSLFDFFGRLTVDREGIRVRPALAGFSIGWDELNQWEVRDTVGTPEGLPVARFWTREEETSNKIRGGYINERDRFRLRRLLKMRVPSLEVIDAPVRRS